MNTEPQETQPAGSALKKSRRFGALQVTAIVLVAIIISVGITAWVVTRYVFPTSFKPVTLSQKEQTVLDKKLKLLDEVRPQASRGENLQSGVAQPPLEPELYTEARETRKVDLTEKELNSLLATNTNMANRLAIDLSENLASAKLLVPLDPDFPVLGGKTVKLSAGLELRYTEGKPVVMLRGVSVWGVPIPNAWLGGMKNVDLIQEFGADSGFWKSLADGVEKIQVEEGKLHIKLKE